MSAMHALELFAFLRVRAHVRERACSYNVLRIRSLSNAIFHFCRLVSPSLSLSISLRLALSRCRSRSCCACSERGQPARATSTCRGVRARAGAHEHVQGHTSTRASTALPPLRVPCLASTHSLASSPSSPQTDSKDPNHPPAHQADLLLLLPLCPRALRHPLHLCPHKRQRHRPRRRALRCAAPGGASSVAARGQDVRHHPRLGPWQWPRDAWDLDPDAPVRGHPGLRAPPCRPPRPALSRSTCSQSSARAPAPSRAPSASAPPTRSLVRSAPWPRTAQVYRHSRGRRRQAPARCEAHLRPSMSAAFSICNCRTLDGDELCPPPPAPASCSPPPAAWWAASDIEEVAGGCRVAPFGVTDSS